MRCQPGTILSSRQYRLHQQLHQDGPIQYWSAHQLSTHAPPQRKLLQIPLPIYLRHYERTQQLDALTYYESLNQSPHIVPVEHVETLTEPNLVAMSPAPGQLLNLILQNYYRTHSSWPWELAVYVAVQVCLGLHHAHTTPDPLYQTPFILHGDIRPESLFLTETGTVQLLPFGQLHLWGDLQEAWPYAVKRRYSYAAPERWLDDGMSLQPRTDLFSVGVLLYELLTGQLPYDGTNVDAVKKQIVSPSLPALRRHVSHLPSRLEAVVYQMIHADPSERPESAQDVAQNLVHLLKKDLGVEGYQQQLVEIYQKFAMPFAPAYPVAQTPSLGEDKSTAPAEDSNRLSTFIRSTPPKLPNQEMIYQTKVDNHALDPLSDSSARNPQGSSFLLAEDLPTQTRQTHDTPAAMSKDPSRFSRPEQQQQPTRVDTARPSPFSGQGQASPFNAVPPTYASPPSGSPFSPIHPASPSSEQETDFDPESTVVDASVIKALRNSMNATTPPSSAASSSAPFTPATAVSSFAGTPPTQSPPSNHPPKPSPSSNSSSNSLTGRFKKYTPPSQDVLPASPSSPSLDQDMPTSRTPGQPAQSSPMTWVDPPGRVKHLDYEEDAGDATSVAPAGSLGATSAFASQAPATPVFAQKVALPPPPPPAPAFPAHSTQNPANHQEDDAGESTGFHSTLSRPRSPGWPTPQPHTLSATPGGSFGTTPSPWSPGTTVDKTFPPPSSSAGLSEALFPSNNDEPEDPTFLQAPVLSSSTGGFSRSMPYATTPAPAHVTIPPAAPPARSTGDSPVFAPPPVHFGENRGYASEQATYPQEQYNLPSSLFSGVTTPTFTPQPSPGFDPAQPLIPDIPLYQEAYPTPSQAHVPLDISTLSSSQEHARPSSFKWIVPLLLVMLVGGGVGASVVVLGWPPWKALLGSSETSQPSPKRMRDLPKTPRLVRHRPIIRPPVEQIARLTPRIPERRDDSTSGPERRDQSSRSSNDNDDKSDSNNDNDNKPDSRDERPVPRRRNTPVIKRRPVVRRTTVVRRQPPKRRKTVRVATVTPRARATTPGPTKAEISVAIEPNCTLYVGKRSLGSSFPQRSLDLPPGNHSLRCINPSIRLLHEFSLLIVAGQSTVYRRKLQAGTLLLKSKPWATIHIQGLGKVGKTGEPISIYEGRFRATLYKQGSNLPNPGNRQTLWLTILPSRENKPDLVVFPVLDDDL